MGHAGRHSVHGDAYVDHPSFGPAVVGRLLEAEGLRVAIVPQPNWRDDLRDFRKLGRPRLFFGVSAGNMDSMVNHYTANKRLRSDDAYTAGGQAGFRPDYAAHGLHAHPEAAVPRHAGRARRGIEASLRRLTHYDYWSDSLKPSILIDSGADLLAYGMGDRVMPEIARAARNGFNMHLLKKLPQVAFVADRKYADSLGDEPLRLYPFERCLKDKRAFGENFRRIETESNRMEARTLVEETEGRFVVVNPPYPKLSEQELDRSFALPYTRLPHPRYNGKGDIPAYEMIKFSVNLHRGCFGGCSFCTISAHQGKFVSSRSERSVLDEVRAITVMPGFKGYLSDLGGPSANHVPDGRTQRGALPAVQPPVPPVSRPLPQPAQRPPSADRALPPGRPRAGHQKVVHRQRHPIRSVRERRLGISARGDSPPCVGTTESRTRAYRGRRAEADAQTLVRAFPNAERAIRPGYAARRASTTN